MPCCRWCRLSGARIVFSNACSSVRLGQTLVNSGLAVAVASIVDVPDAAAWQTAVTFYAELAREGDISRAYKAACVGGDVLYVMLSDGGYAALMARPVLDELKALKAGIIEGQAEQCGSASGRAPAGVAGGWLGGAGGELGGHAGAARVGGAGRWRRPAGGFAETWIASGRL